MTRKRNHTDSWIKVVTALTIIGLILLGALGVFYLMGHSQVMGQPYTQQNYSHRNPHKKYVYGQKRQPKKCRFTPHKVGCLRTQIEEPHEVARHKPGYVRPKTRRAHMRDRVDRLEKNVELLSKTQRHEEALQNMQKRIKNLQNTP